ncbi:MAG: hypothetical protein F4239_02560 [Gammaproteobacteria bacterium]|nr:hypothetical protein [Gammaproteobacteria bacterium]MYI90215.1 hypothetical protein [Gammaproteobacteria bacterium]
MTQIGDLLSGLRSQFPDSLISGQGWERLIDQVGEIPFDEKLTCGFEMPLGDPDPVSDFSIVVAPGPTAQFFIHLGEQDEASSTETWLSRHLVERTGSDDWIDWILLAYDIIDTLPSERTVPAVHLNPGPSQRPEQSKSTLAILENSLSRIAGRSDDNFECQALSIAYAALPVAAAVVFVGVTSRYTTPSVRLVIAGIPMPSLKAYLECLNWMGSTEFLVEFLSSMKDVSDRYLLSIDLTDSGALPRLGLEMYPADLPRVDHRYLLTAWLNTTRGDWNRFVNHTVGLGLCLPAKGTGILSWPRSNKIFTNNRVYRLYMGINHVKFVVSGESIHAKAYAGLNFAPIEPY